MSENVIETRGLTKVFGEDVVVDSLDLAVPKGSVFGFLGVNGAGKTTTVRMIMGHLHPTGGEVRTLGVDPWRHSEADRRRVAYVSDHMNLPGWMKPEYAVRFNASFYPQWDAKLAERLLDEFELRGVGRYRSLSTGQKRRLCLLLAICQNADVLILDEPAAGLDVAVRHKFLDLILEQVYDGERTVFLSSHLLSDLERAVDRIALLDYGRLRLSGELDFLKASVRKIYLPAAIPDESLAQHFETIRYEASEKETVAIVRDFDEERLRTLCEAYRCGEGTRVYGFNLEDLFVELVGAKQPSPTITEHESE